VAIAAGARATRKKMRRSREPRPPGVPPGVNRPRGPGGSTRSPNRAMPHATTPRRRRAHEQPIDRRFEPLAELAGEPVSSACAEPSDRVALTLASPAAGMRRERHEVLVHYQLVGVGSWNQASRYWRATDVLAHAGFSDLAAGTTRSRSWSAVTATSSRRRAISFGAARRGQRASPPHGWIGRNPRKAPGLLLRCRRGNMPTWPESRIPRESARRIGRTNSEASRSAKAIPMMKRKQ
jgi:hypothetical protein